MVDPNAAAAASTPNPVGEPASQRRKIFDYRELLDVIRTLYEDLSEAKLISYMLQTVRGALGAKSVALLLIRKTQNLIIDDPMRLSDRAPAAAPPVGEARTDGGVQTQPGGGPIPGAAPRSWASQVLMKLDPNRSGDIDALVCVDARGLPETPDVRITLDDALIAHFEGQSGATPMTVLRDRFVGAASIDRLDRAGTHVVMPLIRHGKVLGLVLVGDPVTGQPYDGRSIEFVGYLLSQFATSLNTAALLEESETSRKIAVTAANALREEQLRRRAFLRALSDELHGSLATLSQVEHAITGELPTAAVAPLSSARRHLAQLFYDLLELAQGDTRKVPLAEEHEPGDLAEAVERAGVILGIYLDSRPGITFETELPATLPKVALNPTALRWLVFSLLEAGAAKLDVDGVIRVTASADADRLSCFVGVEGTSTSRGAPPPDAEPAPATPPTAANLGEGVERPFRVEGRLGWPIPRCRQVVESAGGTFSLMHAGVPESTSTDEPSARERAMFAVQIEFPVALR